jgi:dolichyl-phosphate-mannose-protein mannosyltransferase
VQLSILLVVLGGEQDFLQGAQVRLSSFQSYLAAGALLAFMALLSGGAAKRESITFDEIAHTGAGVSYWQKLDLRLNEEHPPLSKLIAGLPLVLRGVHADYSHISWTFSGSQFFHQYLAEWVFGYWFLMRWNDPPSTIWWARVPMLGVTLLFGFVLYRIGKRLGGDWGGLLCLACFATTPAFLAFGPLVITDIVIALFWMLTVWQLPKLWQQPGRAALIIFGLTFAAALLSKFSSGLLFFVFPAVALSMRVQPLPGQPSEKVELRKWRRRAWWSFLKGTCWAAVFVYLVYLIFSWNEPTNSFNMIPHFPASPVLRRLLMPPWTYFRGLAGFAVSAGSRPTYLLGHSYPHGVWFYFPVIFALKSQLAFLLLLVVAALSAKMAKRKGAEGATSLVSKRTELHWRCIWVSLVVYVIACMLNRLDISIRHFTIAIALVILLLAPLPQALRSLRVSAPRISLCGTLATVLLVLVSLTAAVRSYPFYMSYINSLGMGKPGYMLVNDSNLDWDQSFPEVEAFARQNKLTSLLFDQYGVREEIYVPQAQPWNCQKPAASDAGQWAVVSANNLADTRNCLWLMRYPHQAIANGSLYAVQLPNTIPAAGQTGGPPLPKDFHVLGIPELQLDIRDIFSACIQDPDQLGPTFEHFEKMGEQMRKKH